MNSKTWAVLSGLSAGAICWFNFGHSDSRDFRKDDIVGYGWVKELLLLIRMVLSVLFHQMIRIRHISLEIQMVCCISRNRKLMYYKFT